MTQTIDAGTRPYTEAAKRTGPAFGAYQILHFAFVVVPLGAGLDKFFDFLDNWDHFLAPVFPDLTNIPTHTFMMGVGVIEIIASLLVAFVPKVGSLVVAFWLAGIIINLFLLQGEYDIVLRDFGLCLGAVALFRLGSMYS